MNIQYEAGTVEKAVKTILKPVKHGVDYRRLTDEEVPVYAFGPGKGPFTGILDSTDQAKNIFKILWNNK
ncbi:hypothetical protein J41TS2_11930 [Bacillus sonorensis]|nr:hypothetical protein J41TS2_11930 [Bacillus sonorensis]